MMIPMGYKSPDSTDSVKSERRKVDKVVEIVGEMRQELSEKLTDFEKIIDIRFSHVDANVQQIRDDQRDGQAAIIAAVEKIVKLHTANVEVLVKHQDEKIQSVKGCVDDHAEENAAKFAAVNAKLDDHGKRLGELEKAPDKAAAGKWREAGNRILWAFVGLLIAGASAWAVGIIKQIQGGAIK